MTPLLVAALACLALASQASAAGGLPPGSPFAGTALWVDRVSPESSAGALAAAGAQAGARTLFVKAGDGVTPDPQFSPGLVSALRGAGVAVCGWTFAYGRDPVAEAAVAVAGAHAGAQCLVIDAEGQYDKLYGPAQSFVRALRSQLGPRFPIGLAGQAEVSQHPTFPYSVFLGPGAFDVDLPQMYWLDLGLSVDSAYAAVLGANSIYARPVLPVGQLYGPPGAPELTRFRALAGAYGSPGLSFFDLDAAQPQELGALGAPLSRAPRRVPLAPILHPGAAGDQVVWAQELLNAAGAHLPVGGFFGAQTARAVARFQASRRLPVSGVVGPVTWKALERLHPREPSWAAAPPYSAR